MKKRLHAGSLRRLLPLFSLLLTGCITHYYPAPQPVVFQAPPAGESAAADAGSNGSDAADQAYSEDSLTPYGEADLGAGEAIAPGIDGVAAPSVTYVVGASYYPWWSLDHFYLGPAYSWGYGWGSGFAAGFRYGSGCGWGWSWSWACPWYGGWAWQPWYYPRPYHVYWPLYHGQPHLQPHELANPPNPTPLPGDGAIAGGNLGSANPHRPPRPTQGDGAPEPLPIPGRGYVSVPPTEGPAGRDGEGPGNTRRLAGGSGAVASSVRSPSATKAPDFLKPQPVASRPAVQPGAPDSSVGRLVLTPPAGRSVRVISSSPGYAPSRVAAPVTTGAVVQRPVGAKSHGGASELKPQPVTSVRPTGSVRSVRLPKASVTVTNPGPAPSRNVGTMRPSYGTPTTPSRTITMPRSSSPPSKQGGYRMATPRAPVQVTPPRSSAPSPAAPKIRGYQGRAD